jgi:hypothetical protein
VVIIVVWVGAPATGPAAAEIALQAEWRFPMTVSRPQGKQIIETPSGRIASTERGLHAR